MILLLAACKTAPFELSDGKGSILAILSIYEEAKDKDSYFWTPSGWMPDGSGIAFQDNYRENCHNGETCIKLGYDSDKKDWVGIYWLANDNWKGPGVNIYKKLGADKTSSIVLSFWVRGEEGGEKTQFKVGGVSAGGDSIEFPLETKWISLEKVWRQYTIDLKGKDLSNVVGGFCWVINKKNNRSRNAVRIFLDDIKYELRNLSGNSF
jgi:hypothetical protein